MNMYKHPKLREAFDIYVREQNALLPSDEELVGIAFSDEFEARMEKLIRRQKHGYYVLFGTMARRVATIVIALFLGATIVTFSVEALRQPVVRFFTEVFETFTRVIFVDDISGTVEMKMEKKAPSYIPEGYMVESEVNAGVVYRITYVNAKTGERIFFRQQWIDINSSIIDTESSAYQNIIVNDIDGFTYRSGDKEYIVLMDNEYAFSVSGTISKEQLIKIAESII